MSAWLTIIGIGDDGLENLPPASRVLLDQAEVVFGSKRILEHADLKETEAIAWTPPLENALAELLGKKGRNVVVLATGDPMLYGMGATLTRHMPPEEMIVVPAPSAFSLAAARLKWPLQNVETISLHAHPVAALQSFLQPGARLIALTGGSNTVNEVAQLLRARGYEQSILTVLEHMVGTDERIVTKTAAECKEESFADFNTLAIECIASPGARHLPRIPGLPDDAFINDGQLTKCEVRAMTLAALGPTHGALLWDIGAGCGSVAIEWMRAAREAHAIAFEANENRVKLIAQNAVALGVPDLEIIPGNAEQTLPGNDTPDAVFIGGAVTSETVFSAGWQALKSGGRMVANAVTLEGEAALAMRHQNLGGELIRIDISQAGVVGSRRAMRPRMAVTQWRAVKE